MPQHVCNGASLQCSFGVTPSMLTVLPVRRVMTSHQPAATILDFQPITNIAPFGVCLSPANPTVIAATSAASGVFTPMPCLPATIAPWTPGASTVTLGHIPSLDNTSSLTCLWGGVIAVAVPGQFTHQIP